MMGQIKKAHLLIPYQKWLKNLIKKGTHYLSPIPFGGRPKILGEMGL